MQGTLTRGERPKRHQGKNPRLIRSRKQPFLLKKARGEKKRRSQLAFKISLTKITPAIAESTDLLETFAFQSVGKGDQFFDSRRRVSDALNEVLEVLSILIVLGGHLINAERVSRPEEIRDKDPRADALGQDVGSL